MISISLLILEITFKFLPVSDTLYPHDVDKNNDRYHFRENSSFTRQTGANFEHIRVKKSNDLGYLSDNNYESNKDYDSIVAVIGDSFVEATQVNNCDTFHGILTNKVKKINFLPFAVSAAPLSQYLKFAEFAEDRVRPDKYIFTIIQNDFTESLLSNQSMEGFQYFLPDGNLSVVNYQPSTLKKFLRNSSFLRYLHIDLKLTYRFALWFEKCIEGSKHYSNIYDVQDSSKYKENQNNYDFVIDLFLKNIAIITKNKPVLFLVDGDRNNIYKNKKDRDLFCLEQKYLSKFIDKVKEYPFFNTIDMHGVFYSDWQKNNTHFDFIYDQHWNEYGHSLIANTIYVDNFIQKF